MPPKAAPYPLQSSPPGLDELLPDAVDAVYDLTQKFRLNRPKFVLSNATRYVQLWQTFTEDKNQRDRIAEFTELEFPIELMLDDVEQRDKDKARDDGIVAEINAMVGIPGDKIGQQLLNYIHNLADNIPLVEMELSARYSDDQETPKRMQQLYDKYQRLRGTIDANTDAFYRRLDTQKAAARAEQLECRKDLDEGQNTIAELRYQLKAANDAKDALRKAYDQLKESDEADTLRPQLLTLQTQLKVISEDRDKARSDLEKALRQPVDSNGKTFPALHTQIDELKTKILALDGKGSTPDYPYGKKGEIAFTAGIASMPTFVLSRVEDLKLRTRLQTLSRSDLEVQFLIGYKSVLMLQEDPKKHEAKHITKDTELQRLRNKLRNTEIENDRLEGVNYNDALDLNKVSDALQEEHTRVLGSLAHLITCSRLLKSADGPEHERVLSEFQERIEALKSMATGHLHEQVELTATYARTMRTHISRIFQQSHDVIIGGLQQIDKADTKIKTSEGKAKDLQDELNDIKALHEQTIGTLRLDHQKELSTLKSGLDKTSLSLDYEKSQLRDSLNQCQNEKTQLRQKVEGLKINVNDHAATITEKASEINSLKLSLQHCNNEKAELEPLKAQSLELRSQLAAEQAKHTECQKNSNDMRDRFNAATDRISQLESNAVGAVQSTSAQVTNLNITIHGLQVERDNLQRGVARASEDLREQKKQFSDAKASTDKLNIDASEVPRLKTTVADLEQLVIESKLNFDQLRQERDGLKAKLTQCDGRKKELLQIISAPDVNQKLAEEWQKCKEQCEDNRLQHLDVLEHWKEVLLTFVLKHSKTAWTSIESNVGDFSEIFTALEEIKRMNINYNGKMGQWYQIILHDRRPIEEDSIILLLQVWYQLMHPNMLPDYQNVLDLGHNLQDAGKDTLDFAAACLEHGVRTQSRMTNPAPDTWSKSQCMAWLRIIDLLHTIYADVSGRSQPNPSISMAEGRRNIIVDGLFEYITSKKMTPVPDKCWLGRYVAEKARAKNISMIFNNLDLIPDGNDLIVISDALKKQSIVRVMSPKSFKLIRNLKSWNFTINNLNVDGKATVIKLDFLSQHYTTVIQNLMQDALARGKAKNADYVALPLE